MKRKSLLIPLFVVALAIALCISALTGCVGSGSGNDDDKEQTYTVTVTGGTGGGEYEEGEECTVTAELGEYETFVRWENADGEEVSTQNPYTFEVEGDVTLVAVTNTQQVTVTVDGGVISGTELYQTSVDIGSTVSVTAPDDKSAPFLYWQIDGVKQSEENPYSFIAEKDTRISAVVDVVCLIKVDGGTISGGETSHIFKTGEQCTITADAAPENQSFVYWYILDENGEEVIISREASYTFNVAESEKYYAKYSKVYTVTVEGGYIRTESGNVTELNVMEGGSCTVNLDYDLIPENKGFVRWDLGNGVTSEQMTYAITDINEDYTVKAVYGDLIRFAAPEMDANQMFRYKNDYRPLEFDRGTSTVFVPNVTGVMFYIYTSAWADIDDYVGRFMLVGDTSGYKLTTTDGQTLLELEGAAGNLWIETKNDYTKDDLFEAFATVLGEEYSSTTPYFLAAQTLGVEGSVYASSEISVIGPMVFVEESIPSHTITISGGTITGTQLTSVTAYKGQTISVTSSAESFKFWLVNGEEEVAQETYEFTVEGDTELIAVSDEVYDISVVGGTFEDGETQVKAVAGQQYTIYADEAPQNQEFVYWYILGADNEEIIVSDNYEYTFTAMGEQTYYAKFKNTYLLTVNGGYVEGLSGDDGVYTVIEGESYTVVANIPEGKGLVEWKIGDESVSQDVKYVIPAISGNVTIEAVYDDLVYLFEVPEMDQNQMFDLEKDSYSTIILDRMKIDGDSTNVDPENRKTAFVENVDHITYYIYTYGYADKNDYVGRFILTRQLNSDGKYSYYLATVEGVRLLDLKGNAGDLYLDQYSRERLFADVFSKVVEGYSPTTPYYLAAQVCGRTGSIYAPSEISVIGPRAFMAQDVPAYTVSVEGGVITGTELTTATIYEGQTISVTAISPDFKYWNINNTDKSVDKTTEYVVTANTTFVVGKDETFTVSVEGGTLQGGGTQAQISSGEECTIVAEEQSGDKVFFGWYVMSGEDKVLVSSDAEYTFWVFSSQTYIAEYVNTHTVTIIYGGELDEQKTYLEGETVTVTLDLSKIPEGMGFTGWRIGDEVVTTEHVYQFVVEGDTTIKAEFAEQVHEFATPEMDANQMFSYKGDYKPLEFDRGSATAFAPNVDHVKFYIYTSPDADKEDYIATFILDANGPDGGSGQVYRLATEDGQTLLALEGGAGNLWLDTKDGYNKDKLFEMFAKVIGENYSADQEYYLAAQACGAAGSIYAPSEISVIGPAPFKQN